MKCWKLLSKPINKLQQHCPIDRYKYTCTCISYLSNSWSYHGTITAIALPLLLLLYFLYAAAAAAATTTTATTTAGHICCCCKECPAGTKSISHSTTHQSARVLQTPSTTRARGNDSDAASGHLLMAAAPTV